MHVGRTGGVFFCCLVRLCQIGGGGWSHGKYAGVGVFCGCGPWLVHWGVLNGWM